MVASLRSKADKAQEIFEDTFSWDERKIIMNRAYWATAADLAESSGHASGVLGPVGTSGALAASVHFATVRDWMTDYENNAGWFTESWGGVPHMGSFMGDVDFLKWARTWVINNMGHHHKHHHNRRLNCPQTHHQTHARVPFDPSVG